MNILYVIDVQKDFKDKNGKYEKIIDFIKRNKDKYYVIGTVFSNKDNSMFEKHLKYSVCKYENISDIKNQIEYPYDELIEKNNYGLNKSTLLVDGHEEKKEIIKFDNFINKENSVTIIGCDADACIMSIAFEFWNSCSNFEILTDYIYTTGKNINMDEVIKMMKRNFGDCIK